MKSILLALLAGEVLLASFILHTNATNVPSIDEKARQNAIATKARLAFSCSPDLSAINFEDSSKQIPLLQGWGDYRMPVTETNDSARIFFEQGINLYYGFHIIESLASFERATRFDNNFAMAYWGKALAYGPNINDLGYSASPDALAAMQKAKDLEGNCTEVEKGLIDAMQVRYSADTTHSRELLNQQYADAMKKVHAQFPESIDAAVLYADALMVQHPWDLYDASGKPKSWTPEIVNTLEAVLKKLPKHPGACHYYIHAIEGSDHPEKGLAVANELPSLMPGVAHLVHMPSHIYIRSGYYNEGIQVNEAAVKSYYNYLDQYSQVANNSPLYLIHNLHMEATCANMDGRYAAAMKASTDCRNSFDSSFMSAGGYIGTYVQYIYMTPFFTQIRFGKWDDILNDAAIPESYVYANILWHYGRGMAYARNHDLEHAKDELTAMQKNMDDPQLQEHPTAFNPAISGARVAEKILKASIALENDDSKNAITLFTEATEQEDNMLYNEPKDWPHPTRQYLGDALIKTGDFLGAEKIFREDLKVNPNNGWSLTGLTTALLMQDKRNESTAMQAKAKKAFERSDAKIAAPVF